jgi:CRP-like cAMP-binding protein
MGHYIDLFESTIASFTLYNRDVERFFLDHYIRRMTYHARDPFFDPNQASVNTIAYVEKGLFKMYTNATNGQEIFTGYLPPHSTMMTLQSGGSLGKFMHACGESTVYIADRMDYLRFLNSSPDLTWHQLNEAYYRRNLNSLPRYESLNMTARQKTWLYILYIGLRLGSADPAHPLMRTAACPPALKEVASYFGIHPNNVSRYYNELRNSDIIDFSPKKLVIYDISRLEAALEAPDKQTKDKP